MIYPKATKVGYQIVGGMEVKTRLSDKPEEIWPWVWHRMGPKAKDDAKKAWKLQKPKHDYARAQRKLLIPIPDAERE